jgi:hypothetical protein
MLHPGLPCFADSVCSCFYKLVIGNEIPTLSDEGLRSAIQPIVAELSASRAVVPPARDEAGELQLRSFRDRDRQRAWCEPRLPVREVSSLVQEGWVVYRPQLVRHL